MTRDEGLAWLASQGGGLKTQTRDGVIRVLAFAHNLASSVVIQNLSDEPELRRCELEAIVDLKQILDD